MGKIGRTRTVLLAAKLVTDDLGSVRIYAGDPVEPRHQGPELLKVGDLRIVKGLPGAHGQEQAVERIIAGPGGGSGHRAHLLVMDQGMRRGATRVRHVSVSFIPDGRENLGVTASGAQPAAIFSA